MIPANTVYRLNSPLAGIRLDEWNSETGNVDHLPRGAIIAVVGPSKFVYMLDVRTGTGLFAFFEEDIRKCGDVLNGSSVAQGPYDLA